MSKDPGEPLQKAVYAALVSSADVIEAFGGELPRIFDDVPDQPKFPYVVIGEDEILDDSHCDAAFECISTIHVFSRPASRPPNKTGRLGKTEAKAIGAAITAALNVELQLGADFISVDDENDQPFQSSRYFYEPDGRTAHGVLTFRFLIDQRAT